MDKLTVTEINTLIEAVDAWTTASKTSSLLAGLFMGALTAKSETGTDEERAEKGKDVVEIFTNGEEDKQKQREEQAITIKAKLLKLRNEAEARELSEELKS